MTNAESTSLVETPVLSAPISTFQEVDASSPVAQSLLDVEEPSAQETTVAADLHLAEEAAFDTPPAEEQLLTGDAVEVAPEVAPVEGVEKTPAPANLLTFHDLKQQPFDVTPDPTYLYFSPSHREALTSLSEGIEHLRGFLTLVAEPGMGKTTLLNKLVEELNDTARVVFLFQTQCSSAELLSFILNELEVDHTGMDVVAMHRALNQALLEEMLRGRRFVLIVDEAQNLQEPVLETIRLLSDFETTHSKLIQIILAGQPQLADTLMRPGLVQLRQRIAILANLRPLSAAETAKYVEYRLRAAGWSGKPLFTPEALARIAESSGGVPRSINNLCFNALLRAFHDGREIIDAETVRKVADKLNLEALVRQPQESAAAQQPTALPEPAGSAQLARALAAALAEDVKPVLPPSSEVSAKFKPKPGIVVVGNVTEKVRSQSWAKRHEYRIQVSLERDPFSGLPIAERYYCCSFYITEEQAATVRAGKPVRIRIEQD